MATQEELDKAADAAREWDAMDPKERTEKALKQNKEIQDRIRKEIEEENEARLQAQRDAVGKEVTSTAGMTFQEAAAATEKLNQPPNFSAAQEREQPHQTQPPARNVPRATEKK